MMLNINISDCETKYVILNTLHEITAASGTSFTKTFFLEFTFFENLHCFVAKTKCISIFSIQAGKCD